MKSFFLCVGFALFLIACGPRVIHEPPQNPLFDGPIVPETAVPPLDPELKVLCLRMESLEKVAIARYEAARNPEERAIYESALKHDIDPTLIRCRQEGVL